MSLTCATVTLQLSPYSRQESTTHINIHNTSKYRSTLQVAQMTKEEFPGDIVIIQILLLIYKSFNHDIKRNPKLIFQHHGQSTKFSNVKSHKTTSGPQLGSSFLCPLETLPMSVVLLAVHLCIWLCCVYYNSVQNLHMYPTFYKQLISTISVDQEK